MNSTSGNYELFAEQSGSRSDHTKQLILRAASELLQSHPGEIPSINEITKKAGIARSTFYAYFTDKDELYQFIVDEFTTLAEKHLVIGITKDNLVESMTTWFRVCQANRDLYVSLSRISDRRFPAAIRQVWTRHLNVMLDIDAMPKNDFRMIHFEYVPRSNTNVTYAWLTQPHLRGIEPITLAQFINTQRLNYLPHAITDSSPLRTPPSLERLKFVASEVVATAKVRELLRIGGEKYLHSHFTDSEILQAERSKISLQYYARFLAAKCVICKCISNHVDERVFPYIFIDIQDDRTADVMLLGWASSLAQECNINHIILNVSYESEYAAAFAIATA